MIPDLPNMPDLPLLEATAIKKPARSALPAIGSEFTMSSGRQAEAEAFAAAMGQAFYINKIQNKASNKRAKAKGRAAQRAAGTQGKEAKKRGSAVGRADRQNFYRTAKSIAKSMGVGPELFKKAKL
jgi:hypothetical protein